MLSKKEIKWLTIALAVASLCVVADKASAAEPKTLNTFVIQQQEPSLGKTYKVRTSQDRPKIKGCKNPMWLFEKRGMHVEPVFEARCKNGKKVFLVGKKN